MNTTVKQLTEIQSIIAEAKELNTQETEACKRISKDKMFINNLPTKRLHLVKKALSTNNINKETLAELLTEVKYNTRTAERYQAMRQWNEDTGDNLLVIKEYEAKAKAVEKTPSPKELQEQGMTKIKARTKAKELKTEAKKKEVGKTDKKENVGFAQVKPTYEELEAEIQTLKDKLKKETALKKQYHKKIKEGVDLTPLKEAEERLDTYWSKIQDSFRAYRAMINKEYKDKRAEKFMLEAMGTDNPFKVLGLSDTATLTDIKKKYKELAKMYHPDTQEGNEELFKDITEAYKVLKEIR